MNKFILISSFFLILCFTVIQGAVIGIDFGSEYFKISLISPGKSFVIIENTTSKRKTPSAVLIIYSFLVFYKQY